MTPLELRLWLLTCMGKKFSAQPGHQNIQSGFGPPPVLNTSSEHFIPITVNVGATNPPPGTALQIANSTSALADGAYLPDVVNGCSRVNATAHGIVISGRFTGCKFVKSVGAAGQLHVGHVYMNSGNTGNLPIAQAEAFKAAVGAVNNHADAFPTNDRVQSPATYGYVIGTLVANAWSWHWLTVSAVGHGDPWIVSCEDITANNNWIAV